MPSKGHLTTHNPQPTKMTDATIEIRLDQEGRNLTAGDILSGKVILNAPSDLGCRGVHVRLMWRSTGKGNRASVDVEPTVLSQGPLPAGSYDYSFRFEVPPGPVSYAGTILGIQWCILAWVDLPWKFDLKAECPFMLAAVPPSMEYTFGPSFRWTGGLLTSIGGGVATATKTFGPIKRSLLFFVAALLFVGGAAMIYTSPDNVQSIAGAVLILISILPARAFHNAGRFESLGLSIVPGCVRRGETLKAQLSVLAKRDIAVREVSLTLVAAERAVSGSGKSQTTHNQRVLELPMIVGGSLNLTAGQTSVFSAEFPLGPDVPVTLQVSSNYVSWEVWVSLCPEKGAEVKWRVPFSVRG